MTLREVGDAEVERLRVVVERTGNAVVRARMKADAARGAGTRDPYKERELVAATDANNKAMHAYDVAGQALERAARRRGRDAMACTLPAEARDHRRRRFGTKVYRAPPFAVNDYVDRGGGAVRVRGGMGAGYIDADRFRAIPSVVPEGSRNKKNRADNWVDRWNHWDNRGPSEVTAVGAVDMPYARAREERLYQERVLAMLQINADRDTNVTLEVGRGALVFEYPYYRLYWLHCLVWGDNSMTEARVRRNQSYVVGWHNH